MNIPVELKYTKDHEWVRIEGDSACIGITDYAQKEYGELVYVDIDSVGKLLEKDDIFGSIEAAKTVSDLFMPIKGKVIETNTLLKEHPKLVNEDPYGKGWLIRIALDSVTELNDLLSAEEYKIIIK